MTAARRQRKHRVRMSTGSASGSRNSGNSSARDEEQHHYRHSQQKHRAHRSTRHYPPRIDRSRRRPSSWSPDTDGEGALLRIAEHRSNQREGRRRQCGACNSSSARVAISMRRSWENAARPTRPKRGCDDHEQSASPDAVADVAHSDQRAGDEESVDVEDPQKLALVGFRSSLRRGPRGLTPSGHRVSSMVARSPRVVHSRRVAFSSVTTISDFGGYVRRQPTAALRAIRPPE